MDRELRREAARNARLGIDLVANAVAYAMAPKENAENVKRVRRALEEQADGE